MTENARLRHRRERVGGLELHWVEAGAGPLVVLLHGFPEFWYSWRRQVEALAAAGFRAVAPDQRGYNLTEKPPGVESYRIGRLGDDIVALIAHLGAEEAHVVGHDWGGVVAWHLGARRPERVERLAVLNAPHPAASRRVALRSDQLLRSWYVFFFQLPLLPEIALRAFDFAAIERILRRQPVREDAFSDDDVAVYKAALARPGALTAALNWYRANLIGKRRDSRGGGADAGASGAPGRPDGSVRHRVEMPTLLIWGERDAYLNSRLSEGLEPWVPDLRVERLPDASHWVQADAPDRVSRLLVEFLGEG